MPAWLKNAVFYEIYPQSYYDANGDGIGDFEGIIAKLDYVKELGCDALWINPCFDSPFKDAGYDVKNYKKAAPRYGTNEDLIRLFAAAHERGIKVLLDLVPGHTSEEHEWFQASCRQERNEFSDRYIWSDFAFQPAAAAGYPYIGGESERSGTYLLNFFKCQPALNYGWLHPQGPWQKPADSEAAIATREAMKDVMRFWMDLGCDGFRVDMASSLVKGDDEKKSGTSRIWKDIRAMLDRDYPECALIAEWSNPALSLEAGFHADFMLNEGSAHRNPAYSTLVRDYQNHGGALADSASSSSGRDDSHSLTSEGFMSSPCFTGLQKAEDHPDFVDHSYFKKDSGGDVLKFLAVYLPYYEASKDKGYISLISCNHDTVRPSFTLSDRELKLFYAFLFTMPGVPFLYYGDEIGMRYESLRTKEGGYFRTGSRTPMQWSDEKNLGFSEADPSSLYLPVDPDGARLSRTVQAQENDPDSLLSAVREAVRVRHAYKELQADGAFEVLHAQSGDPLFVYRRGGRVIAVNPSSKEQSLELSGIPALSDAGTRPVLWSVGSGSLEDGVLNVAPQSFVLF